jgi:hypothetical protein
MTDTTVERHAFSDAIAVAGGGLVAFVGAMIAFKTSDAAMAFHGVVLALAGALGASTRLKTTSGFWRARMSSAARSRRTAATRKLGLVLSDRRTW